MLALQTWGTEFELQNPWERKKDNQKTRNLSVVVDTDNPSGVGTDNPSGVGLQVGGSLGLTGQAA